MNQVDDMPSPADRNLGPGEPLPLYASNSAPPDTARSEERRLKTTANRVDEHDQFRKPVIQHDLNSAIMIEGYLVPSSLAATAIPEPYGLATPFRSIAGMLVDFGGAAIVAAVVALFATHRLPTSWDIGARKKTEERSVEASTRAASTPGKLELTLPPPSRSSAAATRLELESQSVRIASPAFLPATAARPPDLALNRSPPPVPSAAADTHEADGSQQTAPISPTEPSVRTTPLSVEFIIARQLQGGLRRVGCYSGNIDGDWNAASRRALQNFNKHAGTKLDVEVVNLNALGVIRSRISRICPLVCDRGSHIRGNRCASGGRNADRNHMKRISVERSTSIQEPAVSTTSRGATSEPVSTDLRRNTGF
jgi:hypothetical protein